MKRIYVAGKYSADNVVEILQNIGKGQHICSELFGLGYAPFCPWHDHLYAIDLCYDSLTKKQFYDFSIAWLEVSDAVYVISGAGDGTGVDAEIEIAENLGIPIFSTLFDLNEWREHES